MSSKKAMKQAQKQSYAKHRSNITNSRFNSKKKILPKNKPKFKTIVLTKTGGIEDLIESQKNNNSILRKISL